jgi:hypothetical protein
MAWHDFGVAGECWRSDQIRQLWYANPMHACLARSRSCFSWIVVVHSSYFTVLYKSPPLEASKYNLNYTLPIMIFSTCSFESVSFWFVDQPRNVLYP